MRRAAALVALLGALGGAPAAAQDLAAPTGFVTVDQERLFAESAFGGRALAEIERRSRELAAENRRIEAELVAEERLLTELRPTLPPGDFRVRAEAFDARVQRLRAEQDGKEREVTGLRDEAQEVFFGRVGPVLGAVVRERGAVAILDRRAVILALESIDVTDAAIARIDAELGEGTDVWPAAPQGAVAPPAAGAAPEPARGPSAGAAPEQDAGAPRSGTAGDAPDAGPATGGSALPEAPAAADGVGTP